MKNSKRYGIRLIVLVRLKVWPKKSATIKRHTKLLILAAFLILALALVLLGCSKEPAPNQNNKPNNPSVIKHKVMSRGGGYHGHGIIIHHKVVNAQGVAQVAKRVTVFNSDSSYFNTEYTDVLGDAYFDSIPQYGVYGAAVYYDMANYILVFSAINSSPTLVIDTIPGN